MMYDRIHYGTVWYQCKQYDQMLRKIYDETQHQFLGKKNNIDNNSNYLSFFDMMTGSFSVWSSFYIQSIKDS